MIYIKRLFLSSKTLGVKLFALVWVLTLTAYTSAQNNTNSPYTRFGYGRLEDPGFSRSQSMGGVAYGLRSRVNMNPANPASNSSIDSTSFLFEFGVSGLYSNFSSGSNSVNTFTSNLDYLAFQLPITKWMGMSAGLIPYSFVGYNYGTVDSISSTLTQSQTFYGTGGISQAYVGIGATLWKRLSLGVNMYYMFGSINNVRTMTATSSSVTTYATNQTSNLYVQNLNFRYGLQYQETFGRHSFCIGLVYDRLSKLNGEFTQITTGVVSDTVSSDSLKFDMPSLYGGGFSYTYDDRLTVGADYTFQEFSKARYYGKTDTLSNRYKISLGGEYIHNPNGNKYIDRMRWRLGANYSNSYAKFNNIGIQTIAVSCGLGFPLRTTKTMINVNFEYGNIGTSQHTLLSENYFKVGINLTLNELWFFKQRIQ